MSELYESFLSAKKNVNRQGTKILHDIAHAYETGVFDDPRASAMFCTLLACICEGKVQGVLDDASATIKWSLTSEYSAQIEAARDAALQAGFELGNVVKGPWTER